MRPIFTIITDRSALAFGLKPNRSVQSYIGISFFLLDDTRLHDAASTFLGGSVRVK
jgi:hypothetical protein